MLLGASGLVPGSHQAHSGEDGGQAGRPSGFVCGVAPHSKYKVDDGSEHHHQTRRSRFPILEKISDYVLHTVTVRF